LNEIQIWVKWYYQPILLIVLSLVSSNLHCNEIRTYEWPYHINMHSLLNRKGGNCREKPNCQICFFFRLKYVRPDLTLSHFLFFLIVSFTFYCKGPYGIMMHKYNLYALFKPFRKSKITQRHIYRFYSLDNCRIQTLI